MRVVGGARTGAGEPLRRRNERRDRRVATITVQPADTEVDQHGTGRAEHDVGGVHVTVDHTVLVCRRQCLGRADEHGDGLVGVERVAAEDPIGERRTHDELVHHPRHAVQVDTECDHTRHAGMSAEPGQRAGLTFEPNAAERHARGPERTRGQFDDLHRNVPPGPTVPGEPHASASAGPEQPDRPEVRRKVPRPDRRSGCCHRIDVVHGVGRGRGLGHRNWNRHGRTVPSGVRGPSRERGPGGAVVHGTPRLGAVQNTTDDQLHDLVSDRLQQTDLRYTTSRRAIVAVLSQSDRPLTLPEILSADTSLSQSSAYRNLGELTTAGVVHRIVVGDSFAHYELAEDLSSHHHHLVCTNCGRIDDYTAPATLERELHRTLDDIVEQTGFAITAHRLDLLGTCRNCR